MLYRCRHRGQGCQLPGRSANGLHRAVVLGLRELGEDTELQEAIREELGRHLQREPARTGITRQATITSLLAKRSKLFQLHYDDKVTADAFQGEEAKDHGSDRVPAL